MHLQIYFHTCRCMVRESMKILDIQMSLSPSLQVSEVLTMWGDMAKFNPDQLLLWQSQRIPRFFWNCCWHKQRSLIKDLMLALTIDPVRYTSGGFAGQVTQGEAAGAIQVATNRCNKYNGQHGKKKVGNNYPVRKFQCNTYHEAGHWSRVYKSKKAVSKFRPWQGRGYTATITPCKYAGDDTRKTGELSW